MRPVVGRLAHRLRDVAEAETFANACNVMVATPPAIAASNADVHAALFSSFSHLFIDEAHHTPASSWSSRSTAAGERAAEDNPGLARSVVRPIGEDAVDALVAMG